MSKFDVVCAGIAGVDILIQGADMSSGWTEETKLARSVRLAIGGDAANESYALAKLGVKVQLMSGVGEDGAAPFIRGTVEAAGVNTDTLITIPNGGSSALNTIFVHDDGERNFINTGLPATGWKPDPARFGDAKIVSLASFFLPPYHLPEVCLETARAAKEAGKIVCADVVCTPGCKLESIAPALQYVDYLFPNEDEARGLTGKEDLDDIADTFLNLGVGTVVVKLGSRGCLVKNREMREIVPCFKVDNVVDTTGAGDNFLAGFICALLDGKSLVDCARFASGVAGVSIQYQGACGGVQSRQQVEDAIAGKGENALH